MTVKPKPKPKPKRKPGPLPGKKPSIRAIVRGVLPKSATKLFDVLDSKDPEFLDAIIEAVAARYLASVDEYGKLDDPAYKRRAGEESRQMAEELRKLMYLRVQDKAEDDDGVVVWELLHDADG